MNALHDLPALRVACLVAALALAGAPVPAPANGEGLPAPLRTYEAEYRVTRAGLTLGVSTSRLTQVDEGWQYETVAVPGGVARLLVSGNAIEHTRFDVRGGRLRPLLYRQSIPEDDGNARVLFDWELGEATVTDADGTRQVGIEPGMLDPQSVLLFLMQVLAAGGDFPQVRMVDNDGDIEILGFDRGATERIRVPFGEFETVQVRRAREGSDRVTVGWFAPELDWLPIRVEQLRRGSLVARMEMITLDGAEPPSGRRPSPRQQRSPGR